MATVTGSGTVNWSTIPFAPADFQADIVEFNALMAQASAEVDNGQFTLIESTDTLFRVLLDSGGLFELLGTGLGTPGVIVAQIQYFLPDGPILVMAGQIDLVGETDSVTSMSIVRPEGISEVISGDFLLDANGAFLGGPVTELSVTNGSYVSRISGELTVNEAGDISGTIQTLRVQGPDGTIEMTGLALPFDPTLASVTTVDQLLSVIGGQMTGDDTVSYTNDSETGMAFLGGAGNDSIVVGGPNSDTLDGGAGDDTLDGGAGDDTLIGGTGVDSITGGTGDDLIEMLVTAGDVDAANGGAGTHDRLILKGVVGGDNTIVINLGLLDQLVSIAGDPTRDTLVQTGFEAVDASELFSKVNATGTAGADFFLTRDSDDTLTGGAGNDTLIGGAGQDLLVGGTGDDRLEMLVMAGAVDLANGGAGGKDVLVLSGVVGGDDTVVVDLRLADQVVSIAGDPARDTLVQTGFERVDGSQLGGNLNATGTAGANLLIGTDDDDTLTGGVGNDTLAGNGGADRLMGGMGADNLLGGAGDDVLLVASAAEYAGDAINGGNGNDVMRFTSSAAATLVLNATLTQLEEVRIADTAGNSSGTAAINVNASLARSGLSIFGNDGVNVITGTAFQDNLSGLGGNDVFLIGAGSHHAVNESIDGGAGEGNVIRFTRTAADTLTLSAFVTNIREVEASNSAGVNTGIAALNIDASAAPNALIITGNAGSNALTGTAGADTIVGNAGNDRLAGGLGQDTVLGGLGNDRVTMLLTPGDEDVANGGTGGIDTLALTGEGSEIVVDLSAGTGDQLPGVAGLQSNFEYLDASGLDSGGSVSVMGSTGANFIVGSDGNDTIAGGAGNDTLAGGAGVDNLDGGVGNDVLVFASSAEHESSEIVSGGTNLDVIRFTNTEADALVLGASVTGIEQVVIGSAAGVTTGITALDVDASAVAGPLTITGNNGANVITGTGQNDTLNGSGGDDSLVGGVGNDNLLGGANNDTLNGGEGADRLFGGAGNDTYEDVVPGVGGTLVSEALNMGTDTVRTQLTYTLGAHLENLVLLGDEDVDGFGNTLNNVITGNGSANLLGGGAGNDTLTGGGGQDTLNGDAGNDRLVVSVTTDEVVSADGGAGMDTLELHGVAGGAVMVDLAAAASDQASFAGDGSVQSNFEHVDASGLNAGSFLDAQGSGLANLLIGSNDGDTLDGGGNNDTLVGGTGGDNLQGGDGNDLFLIGSGEHEDLETVNGGGGFDIIRFTSTIEGALALSSNVQLIEQVVIGSAAGVTTGITALDVDASAVAGPLTITGNNGANVITGTGQNDTLNGSGGDDSLVGGVGNDNLLGGANNDTLNGGEGADRLFGGAGNDTYDQVLGDVISEAAGGGMDTVRSLAATYTLALNLENLLLLSEAGASGTGNSSSNVLTGSLGNDTLNGAAGNDTIAGGLGEDSIIGGDGNDHVTMLATAGNLDAANGGRGFDTLALTGDAGGVVVVNLAAGAGDQLTTVNGASEDLLQNNFDNLDASGLLNPVNVTGSGGANVITGTPGLLIDNLAGASGNDTYRIFSNDSVTENPGQGTDSVVLLEMLGDYTLPDNVEHLTILGWEGGNASGNGLNNTIVDESGESLALSGGGGADRLLGGAGNDTLSGDAGTDTLMGGAGDDIYRLNFNGPNGDHVDRIVEALNQGTDTVVVRFTGSYTLPANIENGIIGNAGSAALRGNALDNVLQGFAEGAAGFLLDGGAGNDSLVGSVKGDALLGGLGNDTLIGNYGPDTLLAGAGDDVIRLGAIPEFGATEFMDGGAGTDMLQVTGAGQTLDLTIVHNRILGIEIVDLTGSGDNTLILKLGDLLALSTTTDILRVDGDAGDTVASAGQGWVLTEGDPTTIGAHQYNSYTSSLGTLLIDTDITQTNLS